MLVQRVASLHSPETQGLTLNALSRACHVPTLKLQWYSKIMKNDDEARRACRGPMCTAKITQQPPIGLRTQLVEKVCQWCRLHVTQFQICGSNCHFHLLIQHTFCVYSCLYSHILYVPTPVVGAYVKNHRM